MTSAARRHRNVHSSEDASWFAGQNWHPGLVIGHHDVAPWNAVWRDGALVGFIDWDPAGPSSRALDLAFAALSRVPLVPAGMAFVQGFSAFEDRSRRMHLLLDSYGYHADRAEFGALVCAACPDDCGRDPPAGRQRPRRRLAATDGSRLRAGRHRRRRTAPPVLVADLR